MIDFDDIRQRKLSIGDDPNTGVFNALIYDPNNTAASYSVGISVGGNIVQLGNSYTSFPTTLTINASDIKAATGTDLEFGKEYTIRGEVTTDDGTVYNSSRLSYTTDANGVTTITGGNTEGNILSPGSPQALLFKIAPVCETQAAIADFLGSWKVESQSGSGRVTQDIRNNIVNIVSGSEANQFTIQNLWDDGHDFTVSHDAALDGDLSSTKQVSYYDAGRGTLIDSQLESIDDVTTPRAYVCGDLIVLRFYHTQQNTDGALSSIRSVIKLRKQ
jgi:hypothetical protein